MYIITLTYLSDWQHNIRDIKLWATINQIPRPAYQVAKISALVVEMENLLD